jgi:hypothetical protein
LAVLKKRYRHGAQAMCSAKPTAKAVRERRTRAYVTGAGDDQHTTERTNDRTNERTKGRRKQNVEKASEERQLARKAHLPRLENGLEPAFRIRVIFTRVIPGLSTGPPSPDAAAGAGAAA